MRSTTSSIELLVALASCIHTKPTPTDTATDPTTPTTAANVVLLDTEETLYGNWTARAGSSLTFLEDGRLLVGAPSKIQGGMGDQEDDLCWIAERLPGPITGVRLDDEWGDPDTEPEPGNQFGLATLAPGDVTGDSIADLVAYGSYGPSGYGIPVIWGIFPGPDYESSFMIGVLSGNVGGTPCGDLNSDGIAELCSADGIFYGPLTEETTPGLSWVATDPRIASADLDGDETEELFVSDAATSTIYRFSAPSPDGEVSLSSIAAETWTASSGQATALAFGDLDGNGTDELIAGWTGLDADKTLVGLPSGGGDVASASTVLPVRADIIAIGDFDGDGQDDLAVGGASEVTLWLGPLAPGTREITEADARYRGTQYPFDRFGTGLAAADADGDGRSELAIGAPLDNYPDEGCEGEWEGQGPCYAPGRLWWLLGGGL